MPARKKHPSVRARSNRAASAAKLDRVVPLRKRPKLPELIGPNGEPQDWHPHTVAWWTDMWAAPMAAEYHSSDQHALFLLAHLTNDFWTAKSASARKEAAIEIRLQRQAFGLTPYDRRRLEWTVEMVHDAQDRGARRRSERASSTTKPAAGADPRLSLVT